MDASKLQALWDRMEIERLLATYCRGIDRCDVELLKSVYWPDAVEDHGLYVGKAWDFADFIIPILKGMKGTTHQIGNILVELDGDKAAGETYVWTFHLVPGEGGDAEMLVGGRYLDRFERREGEWRISQRLFVMDWNQNQKATAIWDSGMHAELKTRGKSDRSDSSYAFLRGKRPGQP